MKAVLKCICSTLFALLLFCYGRGYGDESTWQNSTRSIKPQRNIRKRQSNAVIYHRHNAERQMRHDIITVYVKIQTRNIEQMFINYLIYIKYISI